MARQGKIAEIERLEDVLQLGVIGPPVPVRGQPEQGHGLDHDAGDESHAPEAHQRRVEEIVVLFEFRTEPAGKAVLGGGIGFSLKPDMAIRADDQMHPDDMILDAAVADGRPVCAGCDRPCYCLSVAGPGGVKRAPMLGFQNAIDLRNFCARLHQENLLIPVRIGAPPVLVRDFNHHLEIGRVDHPAGRDRDIRERPSAAERAHLFVPLRSFSEEDLDAGHRLVVGIHER